MDTEIEAKKETNGEVSLGDIVESEFTEEREGRKVKLFRFWMSCQIGESYILRNEWLE